MSITLTLHRADNARLLADWTPDVSDLTIVSNLHGPESLTGALSQPLHTVFRRYETTGVPVLRATAPDGAPLWRGRIEDVRLEPAGASFTALGNWRAFYDLLYTQLWSDTRVAPWEILTEDEFAPAADASFYFDNNNRLFISPNRNAEIANNTGGAVMYFQPEGGERTVDFTFTYEAFTEATGWQLIVETRPRNFGAGTTHLQASLSAGATGQTPTTLTNLPASEPVILVWLYNNSGGTKTISANETGDIYVKLSGLRLLASTLLDNALDGADIATALEQYVIGYNPAYLRAGGLIVPQGIDWLDEVYQDERPASILQAMADRGDSAERLYDVGVNERGRLFFHQRYLTAQNWRVEPTDLAVERTIENMYNAAYSIYRDNYGRLRRTAIGTDEASVARFGLTRMEAMESYTTSQAQSEGQRDLFLDTAAQVTPRAGITFDNLLAPTGTPVPLWHLRAGDTLTLPNLPVTTEADFVDLVRTMRVTRVEYRPELDAARVTLEVPLPNLENYVVYAVIGATRATATDAITRG